MGLQADIQTAATQILAARTTIQADATKLGAIVNGPASGPSSIVATNNGDVRTAARVLSEMGALASGVAGMRLWSKTAAGGETSLSGTGTEGNALAYIPGNELVYLNGVKLVRGSNYTASNGVSVTGLTALTAGDVIEVIDFVGLGDFVAGQHAMSRLAGRMGVGINFKTRSMAIVDYTGAKSRSARPEALLTVSRASIGAYVDRDRLLKFAAANTLRYHHDRLTGQPLGVLDGQAATNLFLHSIALDNAAWTKSGTLAFGSGSIANGALAPDGTMTADKLVEDTANTTRTVTRSVSFTSGTTYALSRFFKAAERSIAHMFFPSTAFTTAIGAEFNLATGTVTSVDAGGTAYIEAWPDGWYRCVLVATATATVSAAPGFRMRATSGNSTYTGDGVSGMWWWHAQCEVGTRASSVIITDAATASRAADAISLPATAIPGDLAMHTLFVEFTPQELIANQCFADLRTDTSNMIKIGSGATATTLLAEVIVGGVVQASLVLTTGMAVNTTYKVALSWRANDFAASLNGGAVVTDTAGTVPAVTTLRIGDGANAVIGEVLLFARDFTDAETVALAA